MQRAAPVSLLEIYIESGGYIWEHDVFWFDYPAPFSSLPGGRNPPEWEPKYPLEKNLKNFAILPIKKDHIFERKENDLPFNG